MKLSNFKTKRKIVFTALIILLLSCVFLGYSFMGNKTAKALSDVPETTTVTNPLYDFDKYCYDKDALDMLAKQVLSNNSATIDTLITYAKNEAGTMGKPITNKDITLQLGRYQYSANNSPNPLVWIPVYVSKTNNTTQDAVLTLYLAATSTLLATSQQETGFFSNVQTYSTVYSANPPSNSYGTSYIRAFSLGNGGQYAYYSSTTASSGQLTEAEIYETRYNKFSDFVEGKDFTGLLYDDVVTPSDILWQASESYVDYVDENSYCWPNDAYDAPANGNYYLPDYFNYANKTNYSIWKNDKVWLPSVTEVGNGDRDGNGVGTLNGIWELNKNQRSNSQKAWLRSAANNVNKTSGYSTYTMFCTDENGNITTNDLNVSPYTNYQGLAIRPAIHLNLSAIAKKTTPPVNLPDMDKGGFVSTEYNGEEQVISDTKCTLTAEQIPWFRNDGTMRVTFYAGDDPECIHGAVPARNAGTYYMLVQRVGNSWNFLGSTASSKITKFIIEKAKIGVEWEYDSDSIPSIKNIIGEFYPDDIKYGTIPEISMYYRNTGGTGGIFYDYPDKKGYYIAYAYIIDEDIHNYNYALAEINGNKVESNQFYVKQKKIPVPYFKELGEGSNTLNISYKGKQYIEISNISAYLDIEFTLGSGKEEALESVKEMGLTADGVMVYRVEAVANYEINIKIKDTVNIMWETGTETSPDTAPITLYLNITPADITVEFEGVPSSWETLRTLQFSLQVSGVQAGDDENLLISVYYMTPAGSIIPISKDADTGMYTIKSGLSVGIYTLAAALTGSGQWDSNYQMKVTKTQKFEIVQTVSNFNDSLVRWQYKNNGRTTSLLDIGTGNSPSNPVNVSFNDNFYEFTLTVTEDRLSSYYVKAVYSGYKYSQYDEDFVIFDGAKYIKDAGVYCVKVVITAYDKNVAFNDLEYYVYFNINKTTFDLSGVQWDYSSPLTYSGSEQKVLLKADTLPEGLTASYIANTATNAGNYTSTVRFLVSDDYANNYQVPNSSDATTYSGNFNFTIDWQINPQQIELIWDMGDGSSDLLYTPQLVNGGTFVDYSFEHYVNGSWVACNTVEPATTVTEKYRVTATVKSVYANNYELTGSTVPCEFEVQSGKFPVTIHVELNNIRCEDGDEFVYTGHSFNATVAVDSNNAQVSSTVEYYSLDANGNKLNKLSGAPVDVGYYAAVISAVFSSNSYLSDESETEVSFRIIKADIDVSELQWQCTHGYTVISAFFDSDSQKWVDAHGREVVLSFEYDGEPYSFALIGFAEGLTIGNTTGSTGTNAGEYDTVVSFSWDDNHNEPAFPASLHWVINKSPVHFENVKWGYIDSDGNEYEFDDIPSDIYQNGKFIFTRNEYSAENGPVKFTVGLINLPEGVRNLITYSSICLTQVNSTTIPNCASFSAIGQYKTTTTIIGTFTDPNYETFTASNFPTSIPTFLEWEIAKRNLTKTSYNGTWLDFDDRTHDLIELSGIPYDELYYYQVEVTFLDTANGVYNYYEGYQGVPYSAYYAGTYTVRFYELVGDEAEPIFWDSIEIEVGKHSLEVTWDLKGSIPVARVTGVYVSDMIGTRYTNLTGGEVSLEYIMSTKGDQEFIATPYVTESYANNLGFVMAYNQEPEAHFRYEPFELNDYSKAINKDDIEFRYAVMEYTGEPITFELLWWELEFSPYLYYEGDSLTQTEIGTYCIVISFIKYDAQSGAGNAYWAGTTGDRSSIELEFQIVPRTKMPLEYPKLNMYSAQYTGREIVFEITNWIVLQDYIYYNVTFMGRDLGTQLTHVTAGLYTITFYFYEDSIGYWQADASNPKKEYKIQFEIIDPNEENKTLLDPKLQLGNTETTYANYTGEEITFGIVDWDSYYSNYVDVVGSLSATTPGTYHVTLAVKDGVNAVFSDGTKTYTLTYRIISTDPTLPVPLDKPSFVTAIKPYNGANQLFEIGDWDSIYSVYLDMTGDSLSQSAVGEYSVTLTFKPETRAYWSDTNGRDSITLKFYITDSAVPGEPVRLDPNELFIVKDVKEYTGKEIQFDINNWDYFQQYLTIDGGAGTLALLKTEVGEYSISIEIKDPGNVTWVGGSVTPISLKFRISQATITIGGVDEEGKVIITNQDGEQVDADEFLDYVYRDEDGNIVPADQLESGKTYYVTVTVKTDKVEDFNNNFTNGADEFSQDLNNKINNENDGKGVMFVKSQKSGVTPILIITISIVGVLVFLVVATIVVLAVKRRQYADDDYKYSDYEADDY